MLTGMVTFLVLLIGLLAVPLTLKYKMTWQQDFQSDIKLLWLFGLVRLRLPSPQSKIPSSKAEERAQKTDRHERSPSKNPNLFAIVREKAFRRRIIRFIRDTWKAIHKTDIRLRIRIGLDDPADTGQLWAIVGPMAGILSNAREASIQIEPEFLDSTFELDTSGNIRLVPLQIIYLTIGLLLSPPIWKGIKQMRAVEQ